MVGFQHVESAPQQPEAGDGEEQGLDDGPAVPGVEAVHPGDRVESDTALGALTGPLPPLHRVDVDLGTLRQPPGEFVIANLLTAAVIRVDGIGHHRDHGASMVTHRFPPFPARNRGRQS